MHRVVLLLVALVPLRAGATLHLLETGLQLGSVSPGVGVALADPSQPGSTPQQKPAQQPGAAAPPGSPGSLDFDLLGQPAKRDDIDMEALQRRRTMLTWHQGLGLGMFGLQLATTVVGQLNYSDKFGGDNTGRYVAPHAVLAYSTLAAFVAAGTLALLAPNPIPHEDGFDRVSLHKLSMFTAAAGMVAQGALGIWTSTREGYVNQQGIATAHLVIGYVTLAAVMTGIAAIVL